MQRLCQRWLGGVCIPRPLPLLALLVLSLACTGKAHAEITSFQVDHRQPNIARHRTFDVSVSGTGQLTVMQMLSQLHGTFFQHPLGGSTPPSPSVVSAFPDLAYDTFVAVGSPTSSAVNPPPVANLGAINLSGNTGPAIFSQSLLDILWHPDFEYPVVDPTNVLIARLTLPYDAAGQIKFRVHVFENNTSNYYDFTLHVPYVDDFFSGDFSGDGQVDGEDLSLLLGNWGKPSTPAPEGWNGLAPTDPLVDGDELSVLLGTWGQGVGGLTVASTPIPEPASLAAVIFCLVGGVLLRQRGLR